MQSDDKFVSYAAAKALHSVFIKPKELVSGFEPTSADMLFYNFVHYQAWND